MFYYFIKKILFMLNPEKSHEIILRQLKRINNSPFRFIVKQSVNFKPITCMGLKFKNILGLAAGFDKNGEFIDVFASMGFGFLELGTVTPLPQFGNEQPRLFRLPNVEGLINRIGFSNLGVDNLINNIKHSKYDGIIGISIGKNKNTPIEKSKDDYLLCMEKVYSYANYIAINISSPNTKNLRSLQFNDSLNHLLKNLKKKQKLLSEIYKKYVPLLIKVSPDLSEEEISQISDSVISNNIDGIIATNTTINKEIVKGLKNSNEIGGLSGRPIQFKSTEIIRLFSQELKGKIPIIGVGGINSLISAREKIAAGASLLQIYSGLIYHGPKLIKNIINKL